MENELKFDIGFYITLSNNNKNYVNLYKPNFINFLSENDFELIKIEDCLSNINEILKYYESLIKLANQKLEINVQEMIWLRPGIFYNDAIAFEFQWFDKFIETKEFFKEIRKLKQGDYYINREQSWYFEIQRYNKQFLFYQSYNDFDNGMEISNFEHILHSRKTNYHIEKDEDNYITGIWASANRKAFLTQMEKKIKLSNQLIKILSKHFGHNYWLE